MKKRVESPATTPEQLRSRAESAIRSTPVGRAEPREIDLARLAHELEVHQVELQMQNEELLRIQSELQQSRDRYFELYNLAPVGYLTLGRGTRIQDANLRACELLGVERASLIGQPLAARMTASQADVLHRHLEAARESGTKQSCDLVLGSEPGREVPVRVESTAFGAAADAGAGWRSVLLDRTELRRAEEELRASEARAAAILDTVTDAIVSSDASGRIESFNAAAERLFRYAEAEVLGKNLSMLMPDGYFQGDLATGMRQLVGTAGRELVGLRKDGSTFPLELGIGQWWDRGERKFAGILRDISERKRREAALRESEARFRQIAEHVEDVFIVHERADGRISYASPAFERIWGRPVSELYASPRAWVDFVDPEDRDRVVAAYTRFLAGEAPFDEEYRIRRSDGTLRWIRGRAFPIVEPDGRIPRDVRLLQDVTAKRALEEELRHAQKMEAVGALASGVAHDFNNVLQAVLGCLNVARDDATSPERAREYLDRAADSARRAGELTAQLMTFARRQTLRLRPISLDGLIRSTERLIERLITEQIVLDVQTSAPDCAILADPVQIEQILLNLAANARDAMPEGGRLSIRSVALPPEHPELTHHGLDRAQRHVRLVVEDSGTGMEESVRARIFEPFFTTKALGHGTGIGLATVFAMTEQLGGIIDVASELGRGTRFTFYFPCTELAPELPSQRTSAPILLSGSVLLVEDEPLVRMTVRHYLEQLGAAVYAAESPKAAIALCDAHEGTFDLLVSDYVLPEMNGLRLAELLKARYPKLRVLFMSANPELLRDENLDAMAARVLRKPFDKPELASELAALLSASAPSRRAPARTERTVLLVEDEAVARMALDQLLKSRGFRVVATPQPSAALEAANQGPIDLLITDIRLPEMTGYELADELRRRQPELRVIFMSGLSEPPEGEARFVTKPVDFDELLDLIDRTLE